MKVEEIREQCQLMADLLNISISFTNQVLTVKSPSHTATQKYFRLKEKVIDARVLVWSQTTSQWLPATVVKIRDVDGYYHVRLDKETETSDGRDIKLPARWERIRRMEIEVGADSTDEDLSEESLVPEDAALILDGKQTKCSPSVPDAIDRKPSLTSQSDEDWDADDLLPVLTEPTASIHDARRLANASLTTPTTAHDLLIAGLAASIIIGGYLIYRLVRWRWKPHTQHAQTDSDACELSEIVIDNG